MLNSCGFVDHATRASAATSAERMTAPEEKPAAPEAAAALRGGDGGVVFGRHGFGLGGASGSGEVGDVEGRRRLASAFRRARVGSTSRWRCRWPRPCKAACTFGSKLRLGERDLHGWCRSPRRGSRSRRRRFAALVRSLHSSRSKCRRWWASRSPRSSCRPQACCSAVIQSAWLRSVAARAAGSIALSPRARRGEHPKQEGTWRCQWRRSWPNSIRRSRIAVAFCT